ncbi:MAG: hypothetical protein JNN20_10855, partial [Betaproteobacteria bacterium]|nr:hypothetical protein [Betaproteobacteria bacterium]
MNETNTNNPNHPEPVPDKPDYAFEDRRSRARRKDMGILRPSDHDDTNWALGLSGGGIRSATFCLGALQGMEKTTPTGATDATGTSTESSMLRQFDYVSTVSGGGYIGSFFSSLFIPGRLDPPTAPAQTTATITAAGKVALSNKETADQAYRVFTEEPPTRLRWETEYDPARPGRTALAWLRENGRYLIPSGAGDLTYAIAIHVRNWCATHYVLGTVLFTLFALLAAVRATILYFGISTEREWISAYTAYEQSQLSGALNHIRPPFSMDSIWWSPVWWLLLPLLAIWVLPCGLAFWLTHPDKGKTVAEPAKAWTEAVYVCLFLSVLLFCFSLAIYGYVPQWRPLAYLLGAGGLLTALGFVWHHLSLTSGTTVAAQRVTLTRGLSKGFICFGLVAAVAFLDTCAQTLYVQSGNIWHKLSPAAAAGILIWIARHLASLTDERKGPSWLSKIPLDVMAGIAGVVLACLVAVMWAMAVIWVQWDGALPSTDALKSQDAYRLHLVAAWFALGLGLTLALTTGMFPGFLNLSTLQGLYSSRITRAYLGASNSKRFTQTDVKEKRRLRSAAEPAPDDNVDLADIYKNPYAPMHIINTCMNLTSDPAEQLVQRDRKGMPLAVVPGGLSYSDKLFSMPMADDKSEADAKMTVGEWVGVSGAAFTTGLGRSTSLGFSLL